jgi:hypothetical protein
MSMFRRISQLDQKFSWSFFGFLLAVILGGVTIYTQFIKKNSPDLNFEILSNANVLDVHESIGNLDILYKGSSLNRSHQSLRIVVLKVVNDGDRAILPSYYDPEDPIGFKILNGQIVERPVILGAGNLYLLRHTRILQNSPGEVTFSRPILEPGDFFILKFLLLHGNSEEPRVLPVGKVAGVKRISLIRRDKEDSQRPLFLEVAFLGSMWVQLTRAASYSFASVVLLVIIGGSSIAITEILSKRRRSKVVKAFKEYAAPKLTEPDELFFDSFVNSGSYELLVMCDLLGDEIRLKTALGSKINRHEDFALGHRSEQDYDIRLARQLVDRGIIVRTQSGIEVNGSRKEVLADFVGFLRRKGFIQDRSSKVVDTPNISDGII